MKTKGPCKDCGKRTAACHANCEAYLQFAKQAEEERLRRHEYQEQNSWRRSAGIDKRNKIADKYRKRKCYK